MTGNVEFSLHDGLGVVRLDNPPSQELSDPMIAGLQKLSEFTCDKRIKAIMLIGNGRHFCAGFSTDEAQKKIGENAACGDMRRRFEKILACIAYCPVPVAAAIRGACIDEGFELAMHCHFRLASRDALLGYRRTAGIRQAAPEPIPIKQSHGELQARMQGCISGAEACRAGLVDEALKTGDVEPAARRFLHALTANRSSLLIRAVMQSVINGRRLSRDQALREEHALFDSVVRATVAAEMGDVTEADGL